MKNCNLNPLYEKIQSLRYLITEINQDIFNLKIHNDPIIKTEINFIQKLFQEKMTENQADDNDNQNNSKKIFDFENTENFNCVNDEIFLKNVLNANKTLIDKILTKEDMKIFLKEFQNKHQFFYHFTEDFLSKLILIFIRKNDLLNSENISILGNLLTVKLYLMNKDSGHQYRRFSHVENKLKHVSQILNQNTSIPLISNEIVFPKSKLTNLDQKNELDFSNHKFNNNYSENYSKSFYDSEIKQKNHIKNKQNLNFVPNDFENISADVPEITSSFQTVDNKNQFNIFSKINKPNTDEKSNFRNVESSKSNFMSHKENFKSKKLKIRKKFFK